MCIGEWNDKPFSVGTVSASHDFPIQISYEIQPIACIILRVNDAKEIIATCGIKHIQGICQIVVFIK